MSILGTIAAASLKFASGYASSVGNTALSSTLDSLSVAAGGLNSSASAAFSTDPELATVAIAAGIVAAAATGLALSGPISIIASGYSVTIATYLVGTDVTAEAASAALADTLAPYLTAGIQTYADYAAGSLTASAVNALGQFATYYSNLIAGISGSATNSSAGTPPRGNGAPGSAANDVSKGNTYASPLVLDLTGQGLNLTPLSSVSPYFDLSGTGFANQTGWIGSGTGLLCLPTSNGQVTSGLELFGTAGGAANGFTALSAYDTNNDGVINAEDSIFNQLRVWVDANGNGIVDPGELYTLAQLNISSINLNATTANETIYGNNVNLISSYTLANGTALTIGDVWFDNSPTYTEPDVPVAIPAAIAALPQVNGSGTLTSLQSTMVSDSTLQALVQALVGEVASASPQTLQSAVQAILFEWSDSTNINSASDGVSYDAREVDFIQKYTGVAFTKAGYVGDPAGPFDSPVSHWLSGVAITQAWVSAFDSTEARLLLQSGYALPEFQYDAVIDSVLPSDNLSTSIASLFARLGSPSTQNIGKWEIALQVADAFRLDAGLALSSFLSTVAASSSDSIAALASAIISGEKYTVYANGAISLSGVTANSILYAGPSVTSIAISGQYSYEPPSLNDTIVYSRGDGALDIEITDYGTSLNNILLLGNGILSSEVQLGGDASGNLLLYDGTTGDQIEINGMFADDTNDLGIQVVEFSDGSTVTKSQLISLEETATSGPNAFYGTSGADVFDGKGATAGSSDYEQGNGGNDTFIYNAGYGQLEINEADFINGDVNTLRLGNGITPSQVKVTEDVDKNVYLTDGITGDEIKIDGELQTGYLNRYYYGVQQITFADGTTWTRAQLTSSEITGTSGADTLNGTSGADVFDGEGAPAGSEDYEQGNGGADTFIYNQGYGALEVNEIGSTTSVLQLGPGINESSITLTGDSAGNVYLTDGVSGDQVKLDGMLLGAAYGVQQIVFSDGTVWSQSISSETLLPITLQANNGTFNIQDGYTMTLTGSSNLLSVAGPSDVSSVSGYGDSVNLSADDTLNLSGGEGVINAQAGDRVVISSTYGNADTIYATDDLANVTLANGQSSGIYVSSNTEVNVSGSDNSVTLGTDDSVTVSGGGNTINTQSGNYVYITDTGTNADTIIGSNDQTGSVTEVDQGTGIFLGANVAVVINGSNDGLIEGSGDGSTVYDYGDSIALNTGDTLVLSGGGGVVSSQSGDRLVLSSTYGNADTVSANNDLSNADAASGLAAGINLSSNTEAYVTGSNNSISLGTDDSVYVSGGGNTINTQAGNLVSISNTSTNEDVVVGSNDQSGAYTEVNQGTGISISTYNDVSLSGSNDGVTASGNDRLIVNGSNNVLNVGSGSYVEVQTGAENVIFANGDNLVFDGQGGNAVIVGSNNKIIGSYDYFGEYGSNNETIGDYDTVNGSSSTDFTVGINNADYGSETSQSSIPSGSGGYYGFYGLAASKKSSSASGIDVVAQYDATQGYTQAAAAAQAAMEQAEQAAAGAFATSSDTLSQQPSTAFWTEPTITWSFAPGPGTGASAFSAAIGAQEQPIIEEAMDTWAAASGLTFQQVSSDAPADISIGWGDFDTADSGVLGYTTASHSGNSVLSGAVLRLEDPSETALTEDANGQFVYGDTDVTLYQAALHEIGHALGLADNSDPNSVMYATLGPNNTTLDATDLAAIQSLYGPEGSAAAFFSETPLLTVPQATQAALALSAAQSSLLPPSVLH